MVDLVPHDSAGREQREPQSSLLQDGIHKFTSLFLGDDSGKGLSNTQSTRAEVEHYGAEVLKTVPLFLPAVGRLWAVAGYGGSALLQGLDQVHAGDSIGHQAGDFGVGATKGALTKFTFDTLGKLDFKPVNNLVSLGYPRVLAGAPLELTTKAFTFGLSNRFLDSALTSDTWLDKGGKLDVGMGLSTTFGSMVRPEALLTDVAVFAGAPVLLKGANVAFRGALDSSPFARTVAAGSSFGLLSGSLAEAQRQYQQDGHFDPGQIAWRGVLQAGATGLGATVGGWRGSYLASRTPVEGAVPEVANRRVPEHPGPETGHPATATGKEAGIAANSPDVLPAEVPPAVPVEANASPSELLGVKGTEPVSTNDNAGDGASFGAKRYQTTDGQQFWQLADGRIFYETQKGEEFASPSAHIWVPQGSFDRFSSGILEPFKVSTVATDGEPTKSEKIIHLTLDERHGIHRDADGNPYHWADKTNRFNWANRPPAVDDETLDRLHIVSPNAEKDWQSATRLLPAENGQPYESAQIEDWRRVPEGLLLNGQPGEKIEKSHQLGRVYSILTPEQTVAVADAREGLDSGRLDQSAYEAELNRLRGEAVSVLVPESYAQRLDALRDLRKTATLSPEMFPEHSEDILRARRDLFTSPYRDRLLPEQMGQFLDPLPDRSMISRMYLLDGSGDQYAFGGRVADAFDEGRRIRLYAGANSAGNQVREILKHEWTHLAERFNPDLMPLYTVARRLESFSARKYGETNNSEHWAVNLGEMFLDANPELFVTLAHAAPIKTVILADAMQRAMKNAPHGQGTTDAAELKARLDYVKQEIEPIARQRLIAGMRSSNPERVATTADFVSALNSGPAQDSDFQLLERLFDKNALIKAIDRPASERSAGGEFDWQFEARKLMRLQMLSQLDPAAFAMRKARYDTALDTTAAFTRTLFLSGDHPEHEQARKFAGALSGSSSLSGLFARLYPLMELARATLNTKNEAGAKQAFDLITRAPTDRKTKAGLAAAVVSADSPARLPAAKYLLEAHWYGDALSGAEAAGKLVDQKVPEFIGPEFAKYMNDAVDKAFKTTFKADHAAQQLMRGALLEKMVASDPSLLDDPMKERLALLNNLKVMTREWIAEAFGPNGNFGGNSERESAVHLLDSFSRSKDPAIAALTRELAPRAVLEQPLRSGLSADGRILDIGRRLYKSEMDPLIMQLAGEKGPLQSLAVQRALGSSRIELLRQIKPAIDSFSTWGNEQLRSQSIDRLARSVDWALRHPRLTSGMRERLEIRLEMLGELMKPLRMDLQPDRIDSLNVLVDAGERRLNETARRRPG